MPSRHLKVTGTEGGAALRTALEELRHRLGVPHTFPASVLADAERSARTPRLPAEDATHLAMFTLDPPGSRDLDQAMHLARRPHGGYRVHYAIADVAAFVTPGHPLDTEAHRRVATLYFPDLRVPLHPHRIAEDAASLLPDAVRPALLWRLDLDADGALTHAHVRRALVRPHARLDYTTAQRALDDGTAEHALALLRDVGRLREERERARGGVSLTVPEQNIVPHGDSYRLAYRAPLPVEGWNAQLSLLTGMAAAEVMLGSGTGILRTLPAAPDGAVARLHRVAGALGIDWPRHTSYAELVRTLDPRRPAHAAFLLECTTLLRGAGYTVFGPGRPPPGHTVHAAVAAPYAHVTAPLRRLADRYAGELCLAAVAGTAPPDWVSGALAALPGEMDTGHRRAHQVERACVELLEAAVLWDHVGDVFDGYVIDVRENAPHQGTVALREPAVIGRVSAPPDGPPLPLGRPLRVRLLHADPGRSPVSFAPA
ncbi:RNB domain-containing ribonuclease [Streptomyces sp. JJ66]|uniref:RNB domain-containing ribonuclease n=1 Tax=Streptomyces sp. JJ66 TaxID=2803843 RepID=UPI001C585DB6|nr:RNB domain-containing ribonuclease [Streptomyces sp. JJ66]MBW1603491.1 RNB domain-containing ribonuclease [Streptomyces sp. JJ66]